YDNNELTKFRYDVTLHIGKEVASGENFEWRDWQNENMNLAHIKQTLDVGRPEILAIRGISNRRTIDARTYELLKSEDRPRSVSSLISLVERALADSPTADPEELYELGEQFDYEVSTSWINSNSDGSFDAIFKKKDSKQEITFQTIKEVAKPLSEYANNP